MSEKIPAISVVVPIDKTLATLPTPQSALSKHLAAVREAKLSARAKLEPTEQDD